MERRMIHRMKILFQLTKFRISLFSTLSTWVGFVLAHRGLSGEMMFPMLAVFLLASGSCALNQYQERGIDELMKRTEKRPIPSHQLSSSVALKISLVLLLIGFTILSYGSNRMALALGLFAVFWYNGVYTPLKMRTVFAVIPGAFIGTIPPAIGWFSGGGGLDSQILTLCSFFFIWQVPHFWILLLNFRRDYEKVGIPTLTRIFPSAQFNRIIFVWVFATAVASLMIPLFGIVESQAIIGALMMTGAWLIWKAVQFLTARNPSPSFQSTFHAINHYILLVMVLLTLDPLFH